MLCRQPTRPQFLRDQRERQAPQLQRQAPQPQPQRRAPQQQGISAPALYPPPSWFAVAPGGSAGDSTATSNVPAPVSGDAADPGNGTAGGAVASPKGKHGHGTALQHDPLPSACGCHLAAFVRVLIAGVDCMCLNTRQRSWACWLVQAVY